MGRKIDQNKPFTEEDKAYLRSRGRGYLIHANERRFGADGTKTPEPGEEAGDFALSPFYDSETRAKAVYDVGGAPLPNTVLDYDNGRVYDRDNGMTVEYSGPGHAPGAYPVGSSEPEGFQSYAIDANGNPVDDDFDPDIVEYVLSLPNKDAVQEELNEANVPFKSDDGRSKLNDKLIVNLQDRRKAGEKIEFEVEDEGDEDIDGENIDSDADAELQTGEEDNPES